jgi:cobalt-zinc-cadmium efflux system membrane fusion protein
MIVPRWCQTLIVLAVVTACDGKRETTATSDAPATVTVRAVAVTNAPIDQRLSLPASVTVIPSRSAAISATIPARVLSLNVRPGDRVTAGQVIATLAADPNTAADLRKAQVALTAAQRERQRQARLFDVGVAPRSALDLASAAEATADADVHAKSQALRLAQANAALRAPISGLVTAVTGTVGATADTVTPLVTVADLSRVGLQAEVEAKDLAQLTQGATVTVEVTPGVTLPARIQTLPTAVDPATQRARLWIEADNPSMHLHLGQFVTVAVPTPSRRALVLPKAAVVMRQSGAVAYAITGGKAFERRVTVRPADRVDRLEVVSGLAAGTLVARDADPLSDGVPVRMGD